MRRFALASWPVLLLVGACSSWFDPPTMQGPEGLAPLTQKQDTPQLEERAAREREPMPVVPPAPDPETYSYLGTVPPKPTLPTEAEITGQIKGLSAEVDAGSAAIEAQSNAPDPITIPKPGQKPAPEDDGPAPAQTASPMSVPSVAPPQAPFLSGAAPMEGDEAQVFTMDNQAFLPQSQTIERSDRAPVIPPVVQPAVQPAIQSGAQP